MRVHICPLSMTRVCSATRISLRLPAALRGASLMFLTAPVLWLAYGRGTRVTPLVSKSALPGPRRGARCGPPKTVVPPRIGHETAQRRLDWLVEMAEAYLDSVKSPEVVGMGVVSYREKKIDEVRRSRTPLSCSNSVLWQGRSVHVLFKFMGDTHFIWSQRTAAPAHSRVAVPQFAKPVRTN